MVLRDSNCWGTGQRIIFQTSIGKSNQLNQWGYEIEEGGKTPAPFLPRNTGLLIQGFATTRTATQTNKLLINIEPIYVACMFARFALDIITSSGARMNELLQISYDKDCCVVTVDKSVSPQKKLHCPIDPEGKGRTGELLYARRSLQVYD
ncbi:hypothetical protein ACFQI7_35580 [Paenibacillus allorhizosphaerae]|uniref:Tyr recombinase domain-containing protein n=1 Tax=Paenibacillus allorhizosphaerae TaxID=2849866 RepID=A0ABM8VTP7_9BACL|nr:hypothetical protein [Paenibacillus allorhizosphaerae]CAG7658072.1 hypothetical protein PAECIP111802_06940 [Paenibacillus allorhizosphaerae]